MRYKKIVSGLLACAMVVTSVFTGNVSAAKAESTADPAPIATYNFDVSGDNASLGEGVEALEKGQSRIQEQLGQAILQPEEVEKQVIQRLTLLVSLDLSCQSRIWENNIVFLFG